MTDANNMSTDSTVHRGTVHGRTIELDRNPGLPHGQEVTVVVTAEREESGSLEPGEGLRRAFGGWAGEVDELDGFLEWNRRQRKSSRAEIDP